MSRTNAMTFRSKGPTNNVSEYTRASKRLKDALNRAFAEPESSYITLTAADIIARNKG